LKDIIKIQRSVYRKKYLQFGYGPSGVFWNNYTTMNLRFEHLIKPFIGLLPTEFSICDIGSGLCDLHSYLNEKNLDHKYTGIEIVPEMIKKSEKIYKSVRILNIDYLNNSFKEKFDILTLSGTFNMPGGISKIEWDDFIFSVLKKMYSSSRIGFSFNALSTYTTFRSEDLYYLNPGKIIEFIQKRLSRFLIVDAASPLYENTYTVFKPEFIKDLHPHADFKKYFRNDIE